MLERYPKLDYPEGSILHDVRYVKSPESFEVVYFDAITQQLEVKYEDALVDIWFLKDEYRTNKYQIAYAEMDKCYPVYCKYSQIPKAIAQNCGGEWAEYYNANCHNNRYELSRHMCECPWVFKADFLPDVYFRLRWLHQYGSDVDLSKVTFGLLDIETDVLDNTVNLRDITDVKQPVNAATVILPHQKIVALLVLGPRPGQKLHPKFHKLLDNQVNEHEWLLNNIESFKNEIINEDEDNKKYIADYDIRIHLFDYDKEINLIKTIFDYINKYRPWFLESWNAKFDHNYLMNRISYLGYDPHDIIIPKAFKSKQLWYSEDRSEKPSMKNSKDWFFTSTYSVYVCQMKLFAGIRKSQQERRSYSLSSVGKDVAGIDKLTQSKSGTFRQFAYTDFLKFLLYNVRDVVVQLAVELNVEDTKTLVGRSSGFLTQYSKCFQETHIVRNHREDFYESEGYVQACKLKIESGVDTAFRGAYVAPPELNAPTGEIINGMPVNNIMHAVLDADAKAYYPSTKMGLNLDPMSLEYKCNINNHNTFLNGTCVNRSYNQEYVWKDSSSKLHDEDMGAPLFNTYKNGNISSLMYNWFNAPKISDYFTFIDSMIK